MGGLPCAKEIIDNRNAVVQAMDCMAATIQLYSRFRQPTEEQEDRFIAKAKELATVAAEIQAYVEGVEGTEAYQKTIAEEDRLYNRKGG